MNSFTFMVALIFSLEALLSRDVHGKDNNVAKWTDHCWSFR